MRLFPKNNVEQDATKRLLDAENSLLLLSCPTEDWLSPEASFLRLSTSLSLSDSVHLEEELEISLSVLDSSLSVLDVTCSAVDLQLDLGLSACRFIVAINPDLLELISSVSNPDWL